WEEQDGPWEREVEPIASLSLPLNLRDNREHPFPARLTALRSEARRQARLLPVVEH
ncbi:MAG: hypothetical protein IH798_02900, partial [Gemmatimonadetes bacterium]|nr:hypothetical protein [Gemmatimonadota bacterium]